MLDDGEPAAADRGQGWVERAGQGLAASSIQAGPSAHDTRTCDPGSGRACRMALLSNSLTTSAASPIVPGKMPQARSSLRSCPRAVPTLEGTHGSSTTLARLTSMRVPPRGRDHAYPGTKMPRGQAPETAFSPMSICSKSRDMWSQSTP